MIMCEGTEAPRGTKLICNGAKTARVKNIIYNMYILLLLFLYYYYY